ncbi:MAG: hypothetical protein NTW97_01140, partial [Candidatus Krumholzibacteria bacterium]|nr:hypothetical protein [Candidatus Krumholzibacteria bacterium]
ETYGRAIQFALQTGDGNTALMLNDEMKNAQARKTENLQLGLQKLAQTLYKPDGSIDENVYSTLQSYGAVGQAGSALRYFRGDFTETISPGVIIRT